MRSARTFATAFALALSLTATGCFRVSSETRALRDAALESGFEDAEEKIEIGVGFFTVTLAKLATKYIELPPEARTALRSLRNAECAVYEVQSARGSLSSVLAEADRVMEDRGWERLVGVIQSDQLVAVYVPKDLASPRDLTASVLVLNRNQLVCASARADAEDLLELAMSKVKEGMPPRIEPASADVMGPEI